MLHSKRNLVGSHRRQQRRIVPIVLGSTIVVFNHIPNTWSMLVVVAICFGCPSINYEITSKQCRALLQNAIVIVYTPAVRRTLC
jgi:1-acyl-sn-glycerol-3-phosphate acyltransferase